MAKINTPEAPLTTERTNTLGVNYQLKAKRDTTHSTVAIWVKKDQNELMVEIYSKSLVRAIGRVSRT